MALRKTAWSAWHGHGMAGVNQTRPHCVNQMGKTHSKHLAARHAMRESALRSAMRPEREADHRAYEHGCASVVPCALMVWCVITTQQANKTLVTSGHLPPKCKRTALGPFSHTCVRNTSLSFCLAGKEKQPGLSMGQLYRFTSTPVVRNVESNGRAL